MLSPVSFSSCVGRLCIALRELVTTLWVHEYIRFFPCLQFYRALNIRVPLIGLEVWTDRDQCIVTEEPNATLWSFLQWRQKLKSRKKHDNAQLLT